MGPAGYRKWKRDKKLSLTSPPLPPSPPPQKKCKSQGSGFTAVVNFKLNKAAKPKSPVHRLICFGYKYIKHKKH